MLTCQVNHFFPMIQSVVGNSKQTKRKLHEQPMPTKNWVKLAFGLYLLEDFLHLLEINWFDQIMSV